MWLLPAAGFAAPIVLYDASTGLTPGSSGWTTFAPGVAESMGSGYVDFSTLALNGLQGGYTRSVSFGDSFRLRVDVAITSETHANSNRAGFAIIALNHSAQGLELSFWQDEVWVQNVGFTHGEGVAFGTTSGIHRYDLFLVGSLYWLEINGVQMLSGSIRDYSGFGPPYNIPNFLFLGDNTTSAAARIRLAYVEAESIPEPATLSLVGAGLLLCAGRIARCRVRARAGSEP